MLTVHQDNESLEPPDSHFTYANEGQHTPNLQLYFYICFVAISWKHSMLHAFISTYLERKHTKFLDIDYYTYSCKNYVKQINKLRAIHARYSNKQCIKI